ncbi:Chromosome partition protein Smc [bacterium HR10]|nr:Chromosome partition protein Smc [bacterium HR10]
MARKTLDEMLLGRSLPNEPQEGASPAEARRRLWPLLAGAVLILGVVGALLYLIYDLRATTRQLRAELNETNRDMEVVLKRLDDADARYANLKAQLEVTTEHIGITEKELQRARALAAEIKREQEQRVAALQAELARKAEAAQLSALQEEHARRIGAITGEITTVKGDVSATRQEVERTKQEIGSIQLKLSEYGTLIARNREELQELRRRGEREYFEFDITKKSGWQQVADIRIRLTKTDVKRQKFNIALYVGDRQVERKDNLINTPIQFRAERGTSPYELVVNEVKPDRIIGYLAVPKDRAAALRPAITR